MTRNHWPVIWSNKLALYNTNPWAKASQNGTRRPRSSAPQTPKCTLPVLGVWGGAGVECCFVCTKCKVRDISSLSSLRFCESGATPARIWCPGAPPWSVFDLYIKIHVYHIYVIYAHTHKLLSISMLGKVWISRWGGARFWRLDVSPVRAVFIQH